MEITMVKVQSTVRMCLSMHELGGFSVERPLCVHELDVVDIVVREEGMTMDRQTVRTGP